MRASVVDLRTKMREVLQALRRNEVVEVLYHGKVAGRIFPPVQEKPAGQFRSHPFFGMHKKQSGGKSVEKTMDDLRGGRFRAL